MKMLTCGFIGLGLIGGSIAKAIKKHNASIKIIAFDVNADSIACAVNDGIVDVAAESIDENFST